MPQQTAKINPLIKMNFLITENPTQILKDKASQNEKEKKLEENKSSQIISKFFLKTIKLGLNKSQNKSLKNNINEVG